MSRVDLASERKKQIILATIESIINLGYMNFSMQDVAKTANVSKGIIHYYFLNKEDLMMAVLDYVSTEIETLLSSTDTQAPIEHRLSNVIWLCASVIQNKREYYRINMDFWTQINQKDVIRQQIAGHYSKFRQVIGNLIQQGINEGVFRAGNAHQFASIVIAMIDGIALQWLFDEHLFVYDEIIKHCEEAVLKFLKA